MIQNTTFHNSYGDGETTWLNTADLWLSLATLYTIARAIGSITQVSIILLPTVKSTRQTLLYIAGLESQHQSDAVSYTETIASNSEGSLWFEHSPQVYRLAIPWYLASKMTRKSAMEDLDTPDRIRVLRTIDQLRDLGVCEDISLPQASKFELLRA